MNNLLLFIILKSDFEKGELEKLKEIFNNRLNEALKKMK